KSHRVIRQALHLLENMEHRGGQGSEPNTGDGAGILLQIPHAFFSAELGKQGIALPKEGDYAVGMIFMPQDETARAAIEREVEGIIAEEGQTLIGWRTVPTNDEKLGESALAVKPYVRQLFIGKSAALAETLAFERKLYVIRKRAELAIRYAGKDGGSMFYF